MLAIGIFGITGVFVLMIRPGRDLPVLIKNNITPSVMPSGAEKELKPVRLAVMADIHDDWQSLKEGLELARKRGNEMVIVAGDLTNKGTKAELAAVKKVLDESGINYKVIPGNHDLYQGEGNFRSVFGNEVMGGTAYMLPVQTKIILINNGSWKGLGEGQKKWIEEEVKECRVQFCLVVAHMPLEHNFLEHVMGEDSKMVAAEAKELHEILVQNMVKNIISGHLHYDSSYEIEGLRTYLVGAISRDRNTQTPRFTELEIREGEIKREVVGL